jgi:hypothetical protein
MRKNSQKWPKKVDCPPYPPQLPGLDFSLGLKNSEKSEANKVDCHPYLPPDACLHEASACGWGNGGFFGGSHSQW